MYRVPFSPLLFGFHVKVSSESFFGQLLSSVHWSIPLCWPHFFVDLLEESLSPTFVWLSQCEVHLAVCLRASFVVAACVCTQLELGGQ